MIEHRVAAAAGELHVEVSGDGVPVVLLHGLGLCGQLWDRVRQSFGPGYQLVVVDLRSAGKSTETQREELSLARWAADLEAVREELGMDRPALVGHSLGASIALKYALEHPEHVGALVLIGAEANLSNLAPRMNASAERIQAMGMASWVEDFWSKNPPFAPDSIARDPSMLTEYRNLLLENDAVDYVRQCRAIATAESLGDRLGEVMQPALVLVGGNDDRTLPEHGRQLARDIPGARVVELPDVGHSIPLEAPEETAEAIAHFLRDVLPESSGNRAGRARILRADTTPRNPEDGPFGHLDVRWVVGPEQGAKLISFGQSTYPFGATHENHHHPNAEEVVMVVSGRGTQIVGHDALDVGPGDVCFIPSRTPHRITGTSDDDPLVILWAFGGASSLERAGYIPLPDDTKEVP